MPLFSQSALRDGVAMREVWSWAAFDFANSGYTTVVLTAVFNAYFVSVVAGDAPSATFLWTVVIAVSNAVSMLLMPVIGTGPTRPPRRSAGSPSRPSWPWAARSASCSRDRARSSWPPS